MAAKTDQLTAASARATELELHLARSMEASAETAQRLAATKARADSAARAQAEAAVQRQEALASLQVGLGHVLGTGN